MFWLNQAHAATLTPPAATKIAEQWDTLYYFLVIASVISSILVIGGIAYFAYIYRRKSETDKTAYISHNTALEFLWSFIPFVIFMVVFGWGWKLYIDMRTMPKNALEVHVVGKKWDWSFVYKSGKKSGGEFYVPINKPTKLIMSSNDVIHSFFIPGFRMKQDVVPGMYSAIWFEPTKLGTFNVFCTEFCGDGHSEMLAKVHVVSEKEFETWLQDNPYKGMTLAQIGEKAFKTNCTVCHNTDGSKKVGPGLGGVFGSERKFSNAASVVADENYIRESILYPNAKVAEGFPPAMSAFKGLLSEEEVLGLIEYLKTLN